MPGITGISYVCDRCGKSHFVPHIGRAGACIPKDWTRVEGRYLCPNCAVPFRKFITWFFDEDTIPEKWKEKE